MRWWDRPCGLLLPLLLLTANTPLELLRRPSNIVALLKGGFKKVFKRALSDLNVTLLTVFPWKRKLSGSSLTWLTLSQYSLSKPAPSSSSLLLRTTTWRQSWQGSSSIAALVILNAARISTDCTFEYLPMTPWWVTTFPNRPNCITC